MGFLPIYFTLGLIILGLMTLLWPLSLALKNSSIVDVFWGSGFVIATWVAFLLTPDGSTGRRLLLNVLVTVWGLRLSLHILTRNWGKPEISAISLAQRSWRGVWWRSYLRVFLLQGVILWIIAAPLVVAQVSKQPSSLTTLDYLARLSG